MLSATMHTVQKRIEATGKTEKMRQQQKTKFGSNTHKAKDKDKEEATFKQHCSFLQSSEGPLNEKAGFEQFRKTLSDGARKLNNETGFEQYRRSLSDEWKNAESKACFKEFRKSLNIASPPCKQTSRDSLSELFDTKSSKFSQASTEAGECEEDDEGDFSQANTTAGNFADEGLFDSVRFVLH
jgi:hypothetical protein